MRRAAWIGLLVVALLSITASPSHAWRRAWSGGGGGHSGGSGHGGSSWHGGSHGHGGHVHGRFFVGVGPGFWWGWPYAYPYWYYPPPYYGYAPPPYVQDQQTYAQAAPEQAPAPQQPKAYWYYCASAGGYYPTVPTCPEVWIKVPPRSE